MNIWVMIIIGGLCSTQLTNPLLIWRTVKHIFLRVKNIFSKEKKKFNTVAEEIGISSPVCFWVTQAIWFLLGAGILGCWYYFASVDRTVTEIIATLWVCAIINVCNLLKEDDDWNCYKDEKISGAGCLTIMITFVISIGINIHAPIYNYLNQSTANTLLIAEEVPVIETDILLSLEKDMLIQGISFEEPVYRNEHIIYPMTRGGNVSLPGYVIVGENGIPKVIEREIKFSPALLSKNSLTKVAREYMPSNVFWGKWSMQYADNGDIYYAKMYGNFKFLRGGRAVKGVVLVNAHTGECSSYTLENIPAWVDGISE